MKRTMIMWVLLAALLSACATDTPPANGAANGAATSAATTTAELPTPTEMTPPTPEPSATPALPDPTLAPTVELTTHSDVESGFTFDYPAAWMLDSIVLGSRAPAGYQLTSWSHDPGMVSEVPADGTLMNIAVQLWDPKGDLNAFVENRKTAWEASGITIVSEEDLVLANGSPAKAFTVKGVDGAEGFFLFTTLGENYLVASGNGDLESIALVAKSIR